MKRILFLALISAVTFSASSFAKTSPTVFQQAVKTDGAYYEDFGYVSTVYTSLTGRVAFKLEGGFPVANAAHQCPNYYGYAGSETAAPGITSLILEAKATHSRVAVVTTGCDGQWLQLFSVYIL